MKLKYFKVDSFTNELFKGNPACVVPLLEWLEDKILLIRESLCVEKFWKENK